MCIYIYIVSALSTKQRQCKRVGRKGPLTKDELDTTPAHDSINNTLGAFYELLHWDEDECLKAAREYEKNYIESTPKNSKTNLRPFLSTQKIFPEPMGSKTTGARLKFRAKRLEKLIDTKSSSAILTHLKKNVGWMK